MIEQPPDLHAAENSAYAPSLLPSLIFESHKEGIGEIPRIVE